MKVALISPNILTQKRDLFGSGIPYMPVMLSYLAGFLRGKGLDVSVIDAFGEDPLLTSDRGNFIVHGLTAMQVVDRLPQGVQAVCIYAESVVAHSIILEMIGAIRERLPGIPVIVLENTQSVVAYSIARVADEFFSAGADYVLTGEPEIRTEKLLAAIEKGDSAKLIGGVVYKDKRSGNDIETIENLSSFDDLPFPAWDLFPIKNYWKLGFSHGPLSSDKYLPVMSSRGCVYSCAFCVIPETNKRKWRARSAKNVALEMEQENKKYGVREFHFEDLNPTVDKNRIKDMCREIIERRLDVVWKIVSGTKIETLDEETLELMAKAGCRYLSYSPESGSARVLELMKKPFDYELAVRMAKKMHGLGIKSQACFVLGFPGETDLDRMLTKKFMKRLAAAGTDEVALFIMTPIPGTETMGSCTGYSSYEEMTFSPAWRKDFAPLNRFRMKAYGSFIFWRAVYHPVDSARSILRIAQRKFDLKMEMTVYRMFRTLIASRGPRKKAA